MYKLPRHYWPFTFFCIISASWSYYYLSIGQVNDFGAAKFEWLLLLDTLIAIPLVCFYCFNDKKEASLKSLAYVCIIILLGSYIIPEKNKYIWSYLEGLRYVALAAFVLLECLAALGVWFAVKNALNDLVDPDQAIKQSVESVIGKNLVSRWLAFETRVWTYALFAKRVNKDKFIGEQHFSVHTKDGTQNNQLGFILMIFFEMPIAHILLFYFASPQTALIITALTALGLIFFIGEYRALAIRPISVTDTEIIVRYGVWDPHYLSFNDIAKISSSSEFIKRRRGVKRFNLAGNPNVMIALKSGDKIYLGVDQAKDLIESINSRLNFRKN